MYHSIKILYRISALFALISVLPWICIASELNGASTTDGATPFIVTCAALMVPGLFLFIAIALRNIYKELCSDKLSTISMINDLKKQLEEEKKD